MKYWTSCALAMAGIALSFGAQAQAPSDVPANHWARTAVIEVTRQKVMAAPGGKFDGARKVTRTELAVSLASLAQAIEKGVWRSSGSAVVKPSKQADNWKSQPVTRYELAALLSKASRFIQAGIPKKKGKEIGKSEALPERASLSAVPKSNPAYSSLAYLAQNRMVWPKSILLTPGSQPVTGEQMAAALTQMIVGLSDRFTDEPQNRPDIEPPDHKH